MPKRIDLTDQYFGDLKVIKLSDKTNKYNIRLWECRCSCGNTIYVLGGSLRGGHYNSCGCNIRDKRRVDGINKHISSDKVDGTRITALTSKLHKNNTSGVKGVRWEKQRNKWRAEIGYQGKAIKLGYFTNKDDAIAARKEAEEKYHKPYLEDK